MREVRGALFALMHTSVCVCEECLIERHGLVGYLRIVAEKQERDWVATFYEPWLLVLAANRIEELETIVKSSTKAYK